MGKYINIYISKKVITNMILYRNKKRKREERTKCVLDMTKRDEKLERKKSSKILCIF